MKSLWQALRLSVALVSLSVSVLCVLHSLGLVPDAEAVALRGRKELCEAVAIFSSSAAVRGDWTQLKAATRTLMERNPSLRSFAAVRDDGRVAFALGEAARPGATHSPATTGRDDVVLPVHVDGRRWGSIDLRFAPAPRPRGPAILGNPTVRLLAGLTAGMFVSHFFYLLIVFGRQGMRAGDVPERVRATLDALVEGVLLMDNEDRIALVNDSFARTVGRPVGEIEGRHAGDFEWTAARADHPAAGLPWSHAVERGTPETGRLVGLKTSPQRHRTLSVNATPIVADDGACQGVLATFDDMTAVERKNVQLRSLLDKLRQSRDEIHRQNQRLKDLATLDPLTSCLNRRAFFEQVEIAWELAVRHGHPMSCILLDIDHFKSVNDRHGHAVGDEALRVVSKVLLSLARTDDLVCRYGGEEFCILLPQTTVEEACDVADRLRLRVAESVFSGISVTASFGVAGLSLDPTDIQDMINMADEALYAAKRSGRNRVLRRDRLPEIAEATPAKSKTPVAAAESREVSIPYHAVTSLIAALMHRDPATAQHSLRVANLCVLTARGHVSDRDAYIIEIAALLHDVGKLGIPDSILKKPGPLNDDEWERMKDHDLMGVEIITAAFSCEMLRQIIRTHHAWYGGNPRSPELPTGSEIPLGARLLTVADAYDAMISDRVYREAKSRDEAFAELRRCAGAQFDPNMVERFIAAVVEHDNRPVQPIAPISRGEALKIGLLIEGLVDALDARDTARLGGLVAQLGTMATEFRIAAMAERCARLGELLAAGADWQVVMRTASDLLDLCRQARRCDFAP